MMPIICLRSAAVLALLIPALTLTSAVGGPIIIYLSALIALTMMAANLVSRWEPFALKELAPMAIALMAPLIAMWISSAYLGVWSGSEIEKLLRFALAVPVCWMLLRVPSRWLQQVQWSLLCGALAGSLMLIIIIHTPGLGRGALPAYGNRYNAVGFANLTIFFGLASLLTLPWKLSPWPRWESALKIAVVPICLYGVWVSQTRSSWGLLPVFGLVYLLTKRRWTLRAKLVFLSGFVVLMAAVAAMSWHAKESRWRAVVSDLNRYSHNDRDSSVGIRIQLWHASWRMFKESPLVGVGARNFRSELVKLHQQGVVTEKVMVGYGEPHNDMLAALAGYGLLGLLSILALYLIPAAVFWRRSDSDDPVVLVASQIGMLFCLGYFVFSLSEMMFRTMSSVPAYSMTVAVLYALTSARAGSRIGESRVTMRGGLGPRAFQPAKR